MPPSLSWGGVDPRGRDVLAIGVGFRKRCGADTLAALVRDARDRLARAHPALAGAPAVLASIAEKDRPALRGAAAALGLPVVVLPKGALLGTEDRITVASAAARACFGISSVAEAAALTAAGPGARLLLARISVADATCAIAGTAATAASVVP
jgi:cobalt-precorrin 5A hydrolase